MKVQPLGITSSSLAVYAIMGYSLSLNNMQQDPDLLYPNGYTPPPQPPLTPQAPPPGVPQQPGTPQLPSPVPKLPPIDDETPPPSKSREGWKSTLSTIGILVAAPVIALVLTNFVFQSYEVDGPSMESTLQDRDRLIVWKASSTIARMTNRDYIPGRGEIIVFTQGDVAGISGGDKQLIKRVIGLPGERVVIRDGKLTVYNKERPEGFDPQGDRDFGTETAVTAGVIDLVVPEGEVFVVGDNRANSLDSRIFGTIASEEIVGSLAFRIFPFNKAKTF